MQNFSLFCNFSKFSMMFYKNCLKFFKEFKIFLKCIINFVICFQNFSNRWLQFDQILKSCHGKQADFSLTKNFDITMPMNKPCFLLIEFHQVKSVFYVHCKLTCGASRKNYTIAFKSWEEARVFLWLYQRKPMIGIGLRSWGFLDPNIWGAKQGQSQNFGSKGTSNKISYMNSSHVLYCNGVAKISVMGKHSAKCTHHCHQSSKTWKISTKFIKHLHTNLQKSPKFFKHKI